MRDSKKRRVLKFIPEILLQAKNRVTSSKAYDFRCMLKDGLEKRLGCSKPPVEIATEIGSPHSVLPIHSWAKMGGIKWFSGLCG